MIIKKNILSRFALLIFILVLSFAIVNLFFYSRFANSPSSDYANYIAGYMRFENMIDMVENPISWLVLSKNFHFIYYKISIYVGDPEYALYILSVFVVFSFMIIYIRSYSPKFVLPLLLMMHPRFLDLVISQIRMAIALLLFLIALRFGGGFLFYLFLVLALSFHLGVAIPLGALIIYVVCGYFVGNGKLKFDDGNILTAKYYPKIIYFFGTFLLLGVYILLESVALVFGIEVRGLHIGSTGALYVLMWVLSAIYAYSFAPSIILNIYGFIFFSLIWLSSLGIFTDVYSSRLIAMSIGFLILAMPSITLMRQFLLAPVLFLNLFLSYYYWL